MFHASPSYGRPDASLVTRLLGRLIPSALPRLRIALAAAAILVASLYAAPASAQIPGDLRWDPTYGLYNAATDGAVLNWPPGTYFMGPDLTTGFCFILHPLDTSGFRHPRTNLTINAVGVTIVVTEPSVGVFWLRECHGLVINGLTITYDPLPYNQSTVTAIDFVNDTFDVALDAGYLGFEDPFFTYAVPSGPATSNYGVLYDPATTLLKAGVNGNFCRIESAQSLGSGSYRLKVAPGFDGYFSHFEVNDRFAYVGRRLGRNAIDLKGLEPTGTPFNRPPVTLDGCTIHASTSIAVVLRDCPKVSATEAAVIRDCTIVPVTPNELLSTNASLLFATNCRKGPLVEGCWIERESDDAFDIHGDGRYFLGYPNIAPPNGPYSVVDLGPGAALTIGDDLQFWDPLTGGVTEMDIVGLLNIPGEDTGDEDPKRVLLAAPVPGLVVDSNGVDPNETTIVFNLDTACPDVDIRDNVIRNIRGQAAILNTIGGSFTGNNVQGAAQGGIVVANIAAYQFRQGPAPRDILVQRNTVKNSGFWVDASKIVHGASILVAGLKGIPNNQYESADTPIVENVILQGNTVENWNTMGVLMKGIKDCQMTPYLDPSRHIAVPNRFKGVVAFDSRAVTVGFPAETTDIDNVNTISASGLQYAVRIETGVAASVTATHISVKSPTLPLEDLR